MKIAIVYDRLNKWGGAERVLLALNKLFPDAPIFTSIYHRQKASWAKVFPEVSTSFIDKITILRDKHELIPFVMPFAFESFDFSNYDCVISVTSEAAKGILVKPETKHICYCLTPTRYLWSGYDDYFKNKIVKKISSPIISYLKKWDLNASNRPDELIAISTEVKKRIKKYYKRNSKLIFPPVDLKFGKSGKTKVNKNYFLIVSRLVSYKKVDLAIDTFNKSGQKLVIIGTGRQEKDLKSKAASNIKFLGNVSEANLSKIYKGARALIFPQEEDFGLVAVEAQSFGVPVVAFKKGGAIDIIKDGKTGVFFNMQTEEGLARALAKFNKITFKKSDLINSSKRFSVKKFELAFEKLLSNSSNINKR